MKRVYKYELLPQELQIISLPVDSKVLSVIEQNNTIMMYALVDIEEIEMNKYYFAIYGTGHNINDGINTFEFLNTVKLNNGTLVFHVFYQSPI